MNKDDLTTEKLKQKFKSQFELVSYAIRLAENMIKTGRTARVKIESQNIAAQASAEIAANKDKIDEIVQETKEEEMTFESKPHKQEMITAKFHDLKLSEGKKPRKIFT